MRISNDGIVAKILAEVSTIDQSVQVSGVPGFLTRRTETEFVVGQGQTLVLSGLVGAEKNGGESAVPGLGRIPLFGNLFKSKSNRVKQNELVFFVTPYVYENEFEMKMGAVGRDAEGLVKSELGSGLMIPNDYKLKDEQADETENKK